MKARTDAAGPLPSPEAGSGTIARKPLPRTFDRRPKAWLQQFLEFDDLTSERMLNLRRDVLNLSRADAARLLRVARNTIWDWETGYRRAPFSAYLALRLIADSVRRETSADPWRHLPASGNVVAMDKHRLAALLPTRAEEGGRQSVAELAEQVRRASLRKYKRGELEPLGVNPDTGKRIKNTGRYPSTGVYSPILATETSRAPTTESRFKSRRERANELRERMQAFSPLYNAAWMARDAYFGPDERRRERAIAVIRIFMQLLEQTEDFEALLFAVADALYASPSGVPWDC